MNDQMTTMADVRRKLFQPHCEFGLTHREPQTRYWVKVEGTMEEIAAEFSALRAYIESTLK